MKKNIAYSLTVLLITVFVTSCLFTEDPVGSEFTPGTIKGEASVHFGKADSIDYHRQITEEGLASALVRLDETQILGQIISAQFSLRGGKDANPPGEHAYQWQYNLQVDNYAGYLCLPQNFSGRMPSTYSSSQAFNNSLMTGYERVKNYIVPVLNHPQIDSIPELKAMSLLIFNASALEAADAYGPIPYTDYKANKQGHPFVYNAVDTIYATIVHNIDTIVACFNHYESRPDWYKAKVNPLFARYDLISPKKGDRMYNWVRYANSLKLRLAMQISKVNPSLAKEWAESAVAAGVIETPAQQFALIPGEIGFSHPLVMIANTWNDTRLNASLETILKQYEHPMLEFLFMKNSHQIISSDNTSVILPANTTIVGLRSGIPMLSGQGYDTNFRVAYSSVSDNIISMPLFVMKLSEVHFLRAEGALRGWYMGGSAESFYTAGVRDAFAGSQLVQVDESTGWEPLDFETQKYQPIVDSYLNIEAAKDIQYVDPYSSEYNINSLVKVGVKWNNGDDNETKLEKIITQKYIAGFPYSCTAWNDLRRTGYPRIFPVVLDEGDQTIPPGDIIRRIPYPGVDQDAVKKDVESTALKVLGGMGDKQGTRLWWDVAVPNF